MWAVGLPNALIKIVVAALAFNPGAVGSVLGAAEFGRVVYIDVYASAPSALVLGTK